MYINLFASIHYHSSLQVNSFVCTCLSSYTGTTCDTMVDHCDPNPCLTSEECIVDTSDSADNYQCVICIGEYTVNIPLLCMVPLPTQVS